MQEKAEGSTSTSSVTGQNGEDLARRSYFRRTALGTTGAISSEFLTKAPVVRMRRYAIQE